jgi:hypothetical protein
LNAPFPTGVSWSTASGQPLPRPRRCVLSIIDELLTLPGAVSGEEMDLLLDLRWQLRHQNDPEGTLRIFCDLRRRLEQREYLALFRIRRWLEGSMDACVRLCPRSREIIVPLRLDHFCVEAVRRVCLCGALEKARGLMAPRLTFRFRSNTPPSEAPPQ